MLNGYPLLESGVALALPPERFMDGVHHWSALKRSE